MVLEELRVQQGTQAGQSPQVAQQDRPKETAYSRVLPVTAPKTGLFFLAWPMEMSGIITIISSPIGLVHCNRF